MAVLALQVAGAVVGNFLLPGIGGPIGAIAGSVLGNLLFPPSVDAPHVDPVRFSPASFGVYKPWIWGTVRLPAILIDGSPQFTVHQGSSGGKGGPSAPTAATQSIGFLQAEFCMSPDGDREVLALFFNRKLTGDYRTGATNSGELPVVFYDGAADQLADPTLEAFYGVGNVAAYRRRLTAVFTDLDLSSWGNAIPQIEGICSGDAIHTDKPLQLLASNNNSSGHNFETGGRAGRPAITSWPEDGTTPIDIRDVRISPAHNYTYNQTTLAYIAQTGGAAPWPDDVVFEGDEHYQGIGTYVYGDGSSTLLWARLGAQVNGAPDGLTNCPVSHTLPTYLSGSGTLTKWLTTNFLLDAGVTATDTLGAAVQSQDGKALFAFVGTIGSSVVNKWYRIIGGVVVASGTSDNFNVTIGSSSNGTYYHAAMFENDYRHCWLTYGNVNDLTCYWINDSGHFEQAPQHIVTGPTSGSVSGSLDLPLDAGNTSVYALASGCKAGIVCGKSLYLAARCNIFEGQTLLSTVVAKLHDLAGDPSDRYDVAELIDIVRGYLLTQLPTARSAIDGLKPVFAFGSRTRGNVTQYVKLGKPPICAIPDGDLCGHDENGGEIPSPLQEVKGNDLELPSAIWLKHQDPAMDYQINAQVWRRQNTRSTVVQVLDTNVVLTATDAKRIVDMIGRRTMVEADSYTWFTTRGGTAVDANGDPVPYCLLEVEDVVTVKGLDLRILKKVEQMTTGIYRWEAVRSHPEALVQTGSGSGDGDGFPSQEIPTPQETELIVGDWPYITEEGRQDVLTIAMQGALRRSWKGSQLMKSVDGGSNYSALLTDTMPDTIGETLTKLDNFGGGDVFDECSRLDVLIHPGGGELSSGTRQTLLAGSKLAMVGAEMIAYRDANLIYPNTYRLSGFLRGRHGTEWAMRGHAIGDRFVVLPTRNQIDVPHADYGRTRQFKAVTLGRSISTAQAIASRANGVSRATWSPVQLGGGFDGSGNFRMQWRRRARIHGAWIPFVGVPLDEETEKYRVQIWSDGTYSTLKRDIIIRETDNFTRGSPYALYTPTQQADDFGAPLIIPPAWSVAQIGLLGPGYDSLGRLPDLVPDDSLGYVPPINVGDALELAMSWGSPVRLLSGTMDTNQMLIVSFTTGSASSPDNNLPHIGGADFTGPIAPRYAVLSDVAGDINFAHPRLGPGAFATGQPGVEIPFAVGTGSNHGYYPQLALNTTYYFNAKFGGGAAGPVDWFIDLAHPGF